MRQPRQRVDELLRVGVEVEDGAQAVGERHHLAAPGRVGPREDARVAALVHAARHPRDDPIGAEGAEARRRRPERRPATRRPRDIARRRHRRQPRDDAQLEAAVLAAEAGSLTPRDVPQVTRVCIDEAQDVRPLYTRLLRVLGLAADLPWRCRTPLRNRLP